MSDYVIPNWEEFNRPVLEVLSDGVARSRKDLSQEVLDRMGVPADAQAEKLASGGSRSANRVGWALSALVRAEAIEKPKPAVYVITQAGRDLLAENAPRIPQKRLEQLPVWDTYVPKRKPKQRESRDVTSSDADPIELIETGIATFEDNVAAALLKNLQQRHPDFFEQAVVDVLVAMGYGGTEGGGTRLGKSGDGGVDGVIDQDALGLSRIYVQAKRYGPGNTVGRPEVQGFVGALTGRGASQGVFVTTSTFSPGARDYVERVPSRIVLIDGRRLVDLMIHYRVGAHVKKTYNLVEVDEDYFE